ncbi:HAMP domain-containing sensor histidine kinase [Umezawaea tangerina]|uniref:histidine kinase n=1 Tax=Umezawaea tangerina TaxID=84725 RepID=A0A2T0T9K9_9PSEU|nr:HAMP domain-containing sensor histidine kinase [Umezawaea tangerina]PRY42357.1 two-component system sensor histidine kinase MprB [Umezawaea tangerina]
MRARRRAALASALVASAAVVAVALLGYRAATELFEGDAERVFREHVRAAVDATHRAELTPRAFVEAQVGDELLHSRDVVVQVLGGNGVAIRVESDRPTIPVYSDAKEVAALDAAGQQAESGITPRGGDELRLVTVSLGGGRGAVQVARPITRTERLLDGLAWRTAGKAGAVLLLAVLAGWLVARRTTRGLERLAETAHEVAAGGRLDVVLATGGTDEVARLAAAFDSVLVRLAAAREDQRRLVQDANHELRTPLTSLRTNVSVLKRMDELSPESRGQLIEDLDGETRELSHLVAELMEFSSERRVDEEFGAVDLPDLGDRVATRARRRSGRDVLVDAEGVVTGRARGLERALANLVDNAVKFAPDGPVELVLRPTGFRVLDRGPGVAPEDSARIFDRFHRSAAARSLPGSGLGLAIVHEVATTHGGAVFARTRPGGGAEIGFTL